MKVERAVMKNISTSLIGSLAITFSLLLPAASHARPDQIEVTKKTAETQVRRMLEPVLEKYCRDECKLLSVAVTVDVAIPEELEPGFDEFKPSVSALAPSSAKAKILINEKVGKNSRNNLLDLIQQHLDTLDYPVKIDTQLARFPEPIETSGRIAELREKVGKQFKASLEDLFAKYCPNHCMIADFNLQTEPVNSEEVEYGAPGEYIQEGSVAIRVKDLSATILVDESLAPAERANLIEMAKFKTAIFKNVSLSAKAMRFPRPGALVADGTLDPVTGQPIASASRSIASDSKSNTSSSTDSKNQLVASTTSTNTNAESAVKQERFERIEKIERVENGDAVQAELQKFKVYGLIFGCSILSLLVFVAIASYRPKASNSGPSVTRIIQSLASDPVSTSAPSTYRAGESTLSGKEDHSALISRRFEIENLMEDLTRVFIQQPKVAKQVFTRILTEEGVEVTAQYIHLFGESIVIDMLRDPSLQSDLSELLEYYAKNSIEIKEDDKLELLRSLHNRAVAGKLIVMGNRSSNLFDFLSEMDGLQVLELVRNESLTVKSIVLTQVDPQKRAAIYSQLDDDTRMKLLTELSRIDYLPRNYIYNVSNALKRKRVENPRLNTEALPGSEVLVSLLERTGIHMQRTVVKSLESSNVESARVVKSKLVSIDTLRYLRDGQLLEVILSLKHDELLQFLRGAQDVIRTTIFARSPKELVAELEEELANFAAVNRETYAAVERKVLNRMKMMANEGLINLIETNERMFTDQSPDTAFATPQGFQSVENPTQTSIKRIA
ncbi:MAG TPA: hypothetical protein DCS07_15030 [Bdellovibrionales bacterium]|nr:MAG: hypothetical protein A2X97_10850 [Bdellovibrionales bacterium GWA1_52_35]OFZ42163.1 MAG: hypothetical protein A2070_07530 [Bdellovibrionales bacterium GWC1_52_8]HAR43924.1 hypothetical protein [Bdellovibrionales bacterium]HCM38585.1 hypothetical protein [Bdellovibrionales bacterium]